MGEARGLNFVASTTRFLENRLPVRTTEMTSSDMEEGNSAGGRLRFTDVRGMMTRRKRRSSFGRIPLHMVGGRGRVQTARIPGPGPSSLAYLGLNIYELFPPSDIDALNTRPRT